MFGKKKEPMVTVSIDGNVYEVHPEVKSELDKLISKNTSLIFELRSIKPIVSKGGLSQAISRECHLCKYCVKSDYSGEVLGCRRDLVCEHFVPDRDE